MVRCFFVSCYFCKVALFVYERLYKIRFLFGEKAYNHFSYFYRYGKHCEYYIAAGLLNARTNEVKYNKNNYRDNEKKVHYVA